MANGDGPKTVVDWIRYLHNAAQEPQDSPHYAEARQAMADALRHINALNVAATQAEAQPDISKAPAINRTMLAAGAGLEHGLSLGTGEPIAGVLSLIQGKGFRAGAQKYREGLSAIEEQAPLTSATAETAGLFGLPGGTIGPGISAIKAGVPLTLAQGAGLAARGAASGAIPAAVAGFSAGGEDPGDIGARVEAAKRSAVIGAILGGLVTGGVAKIQRGHVERVADLTNKGVQRELAASRLAESRARLARMQPQAPPAGVTAEEAAVAKALGIPVDQVRGRVGFPEPAPSASLPDPLESPTFMRRNTPVPAAPEGLLQPSVPTQRAHQMPDIGTGKVMPYYSRGGKVEQAFAPYPVSSAPAGPTPAALAQFKMLMQMSDAELAQVEGLFPPEVIQQIRALKAQQGLLTP
jgi:hypothetical protein